MTLRRWFLILIVLLTAVPAVVNAQWRRIETGTLAWLHAIHFVDQKVGWVGGSNGTLLATVDGGETWRTISLSSPDTIRDIVFTSPSQGWMLCERSQFGRAKGVNRSYLRQTLDGGKSWSNVEFRYPAEAMTGLFFTKDGKGYATGEGGVVTALSQLSNGETIFGLPSRYLILDGVALEDTKFILVGAGASIVTTDDGGASWRQARGLSTEGSVKINAVMFLDQKRGWAVGSGGVVLSTIDGGNVWQAGRSSSPIDLLDVMFCNATEGFVVGENGIILRSVDGGIKWTNEQVPSKHRLEKLGRAGSNVFAIGFGGTILVRKIDS